MSTTIRIRPEDKERLERIQALWRRLKGEKISHTDLIGHVLSYMERQGDAGIEALAWRPWTEEEFDAFETWFVRDDLPPTNATDEIDRVLYGDEAD